MARRRQTLENPASGERITFRATAAETGGELVAIDLELPPGGRVPGRPAHPPHQEERFEVVGGTMRFRLRRERIVAGPGEVVVVPAGVAARLRQRRRRDRARPRRDPARAQDGAAVRDRGRARRAGTHDAAAASRSRSISPCSRASSSRKCRPPSRHAGSSGSRSHHWPGSPGGAAAISGTRGRERVARSRPQLLPDGRTS